MGIAAEAPARLQARVLHVLGQAADEGHTLLPEPMLIAQATELVGAGDEGITSAITALLATGELVAGTRDGEEGRLLALAPFARAESALASRLQTPHTAAGRTRVGQVFATVDWPVAFGWLAERHGLTLVTEQEAPVRTDLTKPVSILTGGPGTGKTHALRAVLLLAGAKRLRCLLAAPTCRAAKRMQEATGWQGGTLHRAL